MPQERMFGEVPLTVLSEESVDDGLGVESVYVCGQSCRCIGDGDCRAVLR